MTERAARPDQVTVRASTVVLLRDRDSGVEFLMQARRDTIDSFSGALVFPGGKVDPEDEDAVWRDAGPDGTGDRDHRIAAVREVFEECGLLLARPRDRAQAGPDGLVTAARASAIARAWQGPLERGEIEFRQVCEREAMAPAIERLVRFAHWVTPAIMPKIFDTYFYVAAAPPGQQAHHDDGEADELIWLTAADALALADRGERNIVFPTRMNVMKLARWPSSEAILAAAAAAAGEVVRVQPRVSRAGEHRRLQIPPEAGYDCSGAVVQKDGRIVELL